MHIRWAKSVTRSKDLSASAQKLEKSLIRYTAGKTPNWPELPLDFTRLTPFQTAVLTALYAIPSGKVCTYGELAALVGNPKAARAIGKAMATNPFPLIYPCHRVIGANGKMVGFSAEDGVKLKEFLLKHEGVL
jgi:methylated-DNA-[protein]-cysteine S-methyltransferase